MRTQHKSIWAILLAASCSATSQTVTGSGATNTVPVFTGSSIIANSPISVSGGNVGIGTTAPAQKLEVNGNAQVDGTLSVNNGVSYFTNATGGDVLYLMSPNSTDARVFLGMGYDTYNAAIWGLYNYVPGSSLNRLGLGFYNDEGLLNILASGNIGVGTSNPQTKLQLSNGSYLGIMPNNGAYIPASWNRGNAGGIIFSSSANSDGSGWSYGERIINNDYGNGLGLSFDVNYAGNWVNDALFISGKAGSIGNVGIGTTTPQAKLEINGSLRFTADGSVQTTAWTGVLCGGDYAESVDVTGDRTTYGPGDVMVIDPEHDGKFLKSAEPYSTAVLGIYSTRPGALGRRQTSTKSADEVPMAMIGIVPTKVSAENGAIKRGDLLVTSSTPGYAMKGTDRSRMLGAVIGKALSDLDSGTGVIEVGITLQ